MHCAKNTRTLRWRHYWVAPVPNTYSYQESHKFTAHAMRGPSAQTLTLWLVQVPRLTILGNIAATLPHVFLLLFGVAFCALSIHFLFLSSSSNVLTIQCGRNSVMEKIYLKGDTNCPFRDPQRNAVPSIRRKSRMLLNAYDLRLRTPICSAFSRMHFRIHLILLSNGRALHGKMSRRMHQRTRIWLLL